MDRLAIFDVSSDATLTQCQRLSIAAQLSAHGIDCLILPPGVSLALATGSECDPLGEVDEGG